jgi:RNA polymerase sigma-70 factor (ECF subfamily)
VLFRSTFRTLTEPCGLGYRDLQHLGDEDLMRHLVAGHDDALTCLFDRYHRLVLSIGLKVLRDEEEAQDLVQEVFFNLYRTVEKFDPQKGTTKMWIIRGAYRQGLTRRRYLKVRGFYENPAVVDPAEEPAGLGLLTAESVRLVRECLGRLNRVQRETLRSAVFEGMTTDEIAARTGETPSNVRHHYYRGLIKLRAIVLEKTATATSSTTQEAVDARS